MYLFVKRASWVHRVTGVALLGGVFLVVRDAFVNHLSVGLMLGHKVRNIILNGTGTV